MAYAEADAVPRPFFKKTERFQVPDKAYQERHQAYFDQEYHGTDGPLHTIYSKESAENNKYWHATLNNLGVDTNRSHLSGSNVGCWTSLAGVDPESQQRCYSARAYYLPASERKNLILLTKAMTREVVLEQDGDEWVAKGVRFAHEGQEHVVRVKGEVILSCGSVQSPQILELSGVGNPEILKAAGIEVKVANNNVGENLQEHMRESPVPPLLPLFEVLRQLLVSMMIYELDPSVLTPEALRSDALMAAAAEEQYATSKSGPRTAVGYSAAYLPFSHFTPREKLKSLASQLPTSNTRLRDQILLERFSSTDLPTGQVEFLFDVSNYSPFFQSSPGKRYGTMMQMLQYPFSVGSIHIPPTKTSSSPPSTSDDKPIIDPRYFGGPGGEVDFQVMAAAQRFGHKICSTPPLSSIIRERVFPAATKKDTTTTAAVPLTNANHDTANHLDSEVKEDPEEDFSTWVRDSTITDWHPVGTCAMGGHEGIKGGVVDDRLCVYGVRGLRVCDASVMPLQISAHLQATVYAIGEKGAAMVREDWDGGDGRGVQGGNEQVNGAGAGVKGV